MRIAHVDGKGVLIEVADVDDGTDLSHRLPEEVWVQVPDDFDLVPQLFTFDESARSFRPRIVTVARLDDESKLVGFSQVEATTLDERSVVVPDNCDLATDGRYVYKRAERRFDPILPTDEESGSAFGITAVALEAIAAGFRAVEKSGVVLPDVTQRWLGRVELVMARRAQAPPPQSRRVPRRQR